MYLRLSELQSKRIINIVNGSNFGNIIDANIDENGKITFLLIDQGKSIFSLNRESDIRVEWNQIVKIGEDVILVKRD
jgi:YlmC/YmxH family sporulation protein